MMKEDSMRTVDVESENGAVVDNMKTNGAKLFSAMLCCYTAVDFDDPALCGREKSDGICFNTRMCLDLGADSLGVGSLADTKANNEFCKIGAYCCTCALKQPELKCTSVGQRFCLRSAKSYPFDKDYVGEPICACCFLQCYPTVGCLNDAPDAPDNLADVGGGTVTTHSVAKSIIRSHKMQRS
jgi:hypothetical protein